MSDKPRKKARVIREAVKDRHTSHWDLDYLSRAELEDLMEKNRQADETDEPDAPGQGSDRQ